MSANRFERELSFQIYSHFIYSQLYCVRTVFSALLHIVGDPIESCANRECASISPNSLFVSVHHPVPTVVSAHDSQCNRQSCTVQSSVMHSALVSDSQCTRQSFTVHSSVIHSALVNHSQCTRQSFPVQSSVMQCNHPLCSATVRAHHSVRTVFSDL